MRWPYAGRAVDRWRCSLRATHAARTVSILNGSRVRPDWCRLRFWRPTLPNCLKTGAIISNDCFRFGRWQESDCC